MGVMTYLPNHNALQPTALVLLPLPPFRYYLDQSH